LDSLQATNRALISDRRKYNIKICRVGDEVISMLVIIVVWRSFSRGLASSSSLECPVFAPPIVLMASSPGFGRMSSRLGWVGFAPVISVLARCPIN
jgi:hypothetical protein